MKDYMQKLSNPFVQVAGVIALYLIVNLIFHMVGSEHRMPWTLAIAFQLLYILYTVIIGLMNKAGRTYWTYSIIGYAIIMVLNGFLASWLSGVPMDEAGTYRWIYIILVPIFLLFIGITSLIRRIVAMAEKDDREFE